MAKSRNAAGFTLPELLIVLTVLAVLMAAGLPSFGEFVRNQRLKTASFDLFSTLVMSRSEAINRNASVTVTPSVLRPSRCSSIQSHPPIAANTGATFACFPSSL